MACCQTSTHSNASKPIGPTVISSSQKSSRLRRGRHLLEKGQSRLVTKMPQMRVPVIKGVIERRILANYRVDPEVLRRFLPPPFRPQLVGDYGVAGVCLIRLRDVRPKALPCAPGIGSENAAHRVAVVWDENGIERNGVYIPRRDTDSILNHMAGGRLFPGVHHLAEFTVEEDDRRYSVTLQSKDGDTRMSIAGTVSDALPSDSIFTSVDEASKFFENGSLGYSPGQANCCYDGLELRTQSWSVKPLEIEKAESSYFQQFPPGSVTLDHALLMKDIEHEWHDAGPMEAG